MQNRTVTGSFRFVKEEENAASHHGKMPVSIVKNRLVRNAAVIAVLAFGIWGINATGVDVSGRLAGDTAVSGKSTLIQDEDLGRLKFVSSDGAVIPVDGEVVTAFSDSGTGVELKGERKAEVMSILSGTVAKISGDELIIQNDNGTRSIYRGVDTSLDAGEYVEKSQVIGTLSDQLLSLETVSSIGYVDPLDAKELAETAV